MATKLTKELAQKIIDDGKALSRSDPHKMVTTQYHENAKLLANHHDTFCGRAAIEKYYVERNKLDPNCEFEMNFTVDDVHEAGDCGVVDGKYELKKKADKTCIDHGKFLTIVKKVGNDWQCFRLMYNTSKPHPEHKK